MSNGKLTNKITLIRLGLCQSNKPTDMNWFKEGITNIIERR